jgi:hypothetical protein
MLRHEFNRTASAQELNHTSPVVGQLLETPGVQQLGGGQLLETPGVQQSGGKRENRQEVRAGGQWQKKSEMHRPKKREKWFVKTRENNSTQQSDRRGTSVRSLVSVFFFFA